MNGNGKGLIEINLEKTVKERLEEIVERGRVENQAEQILISTAALLSRFLQTRSDQNAEIISQIKKQQKEAGFFFLPITEAFFKWMKEGREDIPEKIEKLAAERRENE